MDILDFKSCQKDTTLVQNPLKNICGNFGDWAFSDFEEVENMKKSLRDMYTDGHWTFFFIKKKRTWHTGWDKIKVLFSHCQYIFAIHFVDTFIYLYNIQTNEISEDEMRLTWFWFYVDFRQKCLINQSLSKPLNNIQAVITCT